MGCEEVLELGIAVNGTSKVGYQFKEGYRFK